MVSSPKPKHAELRDALHARGLRFTRSRAAVLDVVQRSTHPLSHADVAARLERDGWESASIYRNLVDLAEAGLLKRTDLGDHVWRFEVARGEQHEQQHPHFLCTACGVVECLPALALEHAKGAPRSVRLKKVEIHVRGLCDACA
jgi:Fur family ferric uptake transcriptional regulator